HYSGCRFFRVEVTHRSILSGPHGFDPVLAFWRVGVGGLPLGKRLVQLTSQKPPHTRFDVDCRLNSKKPPTPAGSARGSRVTRQPSIFCPTQGIFSFEMDGVGSTRGASRLGPR